MTSTRTWWEVRLRVAARFEEEAVAALWNTRCLGVESRRRLRSEDPEGPAQQGRGRVTLFAFYPASRAPRPLAQGVRRALSEAAIPGAAASRPRRVADQRWVERWQHSLRAMPIGRRFLALPEGCPAPGAGRRIPLRIPFGQAFGTGEHASTRLSLALLESTLKDGDRVIDVGTGTGILAIAALRLGARSALGIDSDPVAVSVARQTRRMNRIGPALILRRADAADALRRSGCDVALVNIGARVIRDLLPRLSRALRPGGRAILAGLLVEDERDLVRCARRAGLRLAARRRKPPWSALLVVKVSAPTGRH